MSLSRFREEFGDSLEAVTRGAMSSIGGEKSGTKGGKTATRSGRRENMQSTSSTSKAGANADANTATSKEHVFTTAVKSSTSQSRVFQVDGLTCTCAFVPPPSPPLTCPLLLRRRYHHCHYHHHHCHLARRRRRRAAGAWYKRRAWRCGRPRRERSCSVRTGAHWGLTKPRSSRLPDQVCVPKTHSYTVTLPHCSLHTPPLSNLPH